MTSVSCCMYWLHNPDYVNCYCPHCALKTLTLIGSNLFTPRLSCFPVMNTVLETPEPSFFFFLHLLPYETVHKYRALTLV